MPLLIKCLRLGQNKIVSESYMPTQFIDKRRQSVWNELKFSISNNKEGKEFDSTCIHTQKSIRDHGKYSSVHISRSNVFPRKL